MFDHLADLVRARVPGLIAVYAFGSRLGGNPLPESDYDLALLAARPLEPLDRWYLQEELASVARTNVDLVDLRRASTVMRVEVLRNCELLFEDPAERSTRELFEALALADYARLNEERRGVLSDIQARGSVHG